MSVVFINYRTADTAMEAQIIHAKLAERQASSGVRPQGALRTAGQDFVLTLDAPD